MDINKTNTIKQTENITVENDSGKGSCRTGEKDKEQKKNVNTYGEERKEAGSTQKKDDQAD